MRPKLNKVTWKAIHIIISIDELEDSLVTSSTKRGISRDEFFATIFKLVQDKGYDPRMPIARMKKLLKSPYSDSEYYTFLKIENDERVKVVLDIRIADHGLKEWGNYSARDRKLHHMQNSEVPDIANETGLDVSNAEVRFHDIVENKGAMFTIINIDGDPFTGYSDALVEMKKKIEDLP